MAPLLHPVSEGVRPQPIAFSDEYRRRTLAQDRAIIDRIIRAYHRAASLADPAVRRSMCGTIWGEKGVVGKQGALIQALEERSAAGVHETLRSYFASDAAYGIAMGREEGQVVREHPEHRRHYGLMWLDRLVGLAQAVGAISIPNPEDSAERHAKSLEVDPEAVIRAIEDRLGIRVEFPEMGGVFGGELRGRPFPFIAFTHLLVAVNVRALVPREPATVYEIGGGFGGLAYFATQLLRCRYTIFDLAWTNAVQAYFLHRALPDRPLVLCGEGGGGEGAIGLQPAWELFRQRPGTRVDLVVNQDSMPEMPQATARGYLEAMKGFLQGPFLSVNQEPPAFSAQTWDRTAVAQLVEAVGGYHRLVRAPFFLRMGYVQEVYYPSRAGALPLPEGRVDRTGAGAVYAPPIAGSAPASRHPLRTAYRLMRQGDFRGLRERVRRRLGGLFRPAV